MPLDVCYQPRRLETLASARASQLALESCLQIQQRFPESQHLVQAKEVHDYFLTIRPLLDNVLNQCIATARAEPLGIRAEVLLHALVHPAMKTLSYSYIPRPVTSWEHIPGFELVFVVDVFVDYFDGCEYVGKYLRVEPRLWEKYLQRLGNLTDLNLIGIDNRLINLVLKTVSTSCRMLEIISISIESTTDVEALLHLAKVRSLRAIKSWESFYKIPFNICYDLKIRLRYYDDSWQGREVLRYLLSNLPLLEYIPIRNIGAILTRMKEVQAEPLVLVECLECHPSQAKLEAIVDMCPNLTGLYLQGNYDDDSYDDTSLDLSPLTGSNLQVSKLVFCDLTIRPDGSLEHFLRIKGRFIKHMRLDGVNSRDIEIIPFLVGKHCPMLETLHLRLEKDLNGNHPSATSSQSQEPMLQNLVEFKFKTSSVTEALWEMLLPCLYAAVRLNTIDLQGQYKSRPLFAQAMCNLLDNNPMSELEELAFDNCEIESVELVTRLANLPKLRNFALHSCTYTPQVRAHLNSLRNAVDNLDIFDTRCCRGNSFDGAVYPV